MTALPLLRLDVPVVPDAATARRWAIEELANPAYHHGRSLLGRLIDWLSSLFQGGAPIVGLPPGAVAALVVLATLLLAAVAFWVAGPVRLARRAATSAVVLGDDSHTSPQLRAAADACAARGEWADAVLNRFRAIVRALEERALLDERPGRTAHEAAEAAAVRLPSRTVELRRAGRIFDEVCYGKASVGSGTDAWLRELDLGLAGTHPAPTSDRRLVRAL